jgi:hypothetical protein
MQIVPFRAHGVVPEAFTKSFSLPAFVLKRGTRGANTALLPLICYTMSLRRRTVEEVMRK